MEQLHTRWGLEGERCQTCACGRSFSQENSFNKHRRVCQKSKKRLSSALDKAKQLWTGKKRRRLNPDDSETTVNEPSLAGLIPISSLAPQDIVEVGHIFFEG